MPQCFYILMRHFLRIDGVFVRQVLGKGLRNGYLELCGCELKACELKAECTAAKIMIERVQYPFCCGAFRNGVGGM